MYNNLTDAVNSINQSSPVVDPQFSDASLLAWIIVKQGTTNLNDTVNNKIIHAGKFGEGSVGASSGGDVFGPASSTSNSIARFDGATGKYIKDGGESFTNTSNHVTYAILNPIYNQVGGNGLSNVDLLVNRTETSIGSNPSHQYLLELSVNNIKKFSVDNTGSASYNGIALSIVTKTNDYNLLLNDYTVLCDTTSNNVTITLLDATTCSGSIFIFKRISAGANNCIIATTLSQTIDGATSKSITTQYSTLRIQSNGSEWIVI
jgi:hypothetical protein